MSVPDIASAMYAAMGGEDRRRQLASQRPGHGALLPLPDPPSGAAPGKFDAMGPPVGEGYSLTPDIAAAVHKSYGPDRPVYADDVVSGYGFQGGRAEPAITMYMGSRSAAGDGLVVVSAPPQGSLWSRLTARLRRR
jgi:hypothetical protein